MLLYHPAFDIYHGAFRILSLLMSMDAKPYEALKIRILDFYMLFPDQIARMTLPRGSTREKRDFAAMKNRYNYVNEPHQLFSSMEPYQQAALRYLCSYGILEIESLRNDSVLITDISIPSVLSIAIQTEQRNNNDVIKFVGSVLGSMELSGKNGLKARSNLAEYRYDSRP